MVLQIWEEAFDHFRTCALRNQVRLILRTGKPLSLEYLADVLVDPDRPRVAAGPLAGIMDP